MEYTYSSHNHEGAGWEFGTCLWSPSKNRSGADIYSGMREIRVGDVIVHVLDSVIAGVSRAAGTCKEIDREPPQPGDWANRAAYYRVDVRDFEDLRNKFPIAELIKQCSSEIRQELREDHPAHYPFYAVGGDGEIKPNQGGYDYGPRRLPHAAQNPIGWRICFVWKDGDAYKVAIVDYH